MATLKANGTEIVRLDLIKRPWDIDGLLIKRVISARSNGWILFKDTSTDNAGRTYPGTWRRGPRFEARGVDVQALTKSIRRYYEVRGFGATE